jgi:hypothetical protein
LLAEPISSTLKMEAICSSETSVETQWTTWRHIPEDDTPHNHGCENLKSYNRIFLCIPCELFLIIVVIIKQNVGKQSNCLSSSCRPVGNQTTVKLASQYLAPCKRAFTHGFHHRICQSKDYHLSSKNFRDSKCGRYIHSNPRTPRTMVSYLV